MKELFVGFDQAFAKSGWAVLEWDSHSHKLRYAESGVFHPSIKWGHKSDAIAFLEHQYHIKTLLTRLEGEGHIHAIGMEGVAFAAPGQAASRGGIFALYSTMSIPFADLIIIAPTMMKKYMTEYGFAEKEDIKKVVEPRYHLEGKDLEEDEYDAISLAEMGAFAFMVKHGEEDVVKKLISPNQLMVFTDKTRIAKKKRKSKNPKKKEKEIDPETLKMKGICNRIDDFYIPRREN